MVRAATVITLVAMLSGLASGQAPGVLHVRVTLTDAARASMPIPRHALLISDNPSTSAPRRIVTAADGSAQIRLPPGNYTVESDEPVSFNGKGYQWTRTVDVTAGGDVLLELTAANAEVVAAPASSANESDPSLLLAHWQGSVVAVWTPESRASGFVVDASGLVVTSQRVIGTASAVDVQLTPAVKVAARVLASDRVRDVAVLWIDPATAASVPPLPLGCANGSRPPIADRQKMVNIGVPLSGPKEISPGDVIRLDPHAIVADFRLAPGSTGGPIFTTDGTLVGLSSIADAQDQGRNRDARVVPLDDACQVVAAAEKVMQTGKRPDAARLPVEPLRPFPADALDAAVKRHAGNASPFTMSSSDFDIAFLTPPLISVQQRNPPRANAPKDFGVWADYFADLPSVLVIRVTPKLTESFWTTIARGAAYTQGMALPPIKHFKPGFARLRAYCGETEVMPIHPFTLEQRVSETDAIREGLYVFDSQALGPQCKAVKLLLYSEKDPQKPDSRVVEPQLIEQISKDFAT
jgi:S1-C subfamily serine protease